MKKLLMCLTVILSFIGINKVSASELFLTDVSEENFLQYKEIMGVDNFNTVIDSLVEKYKKDYATYYPYFYISVEFSYDIPSDPTLLYADFRLACSKEVPEIYWTSASSGASVLTRLKESDVVHSYLYTVVEDGEFVFDSSNYVDGNDLVGWLTNIIRINSDDFSFNPYEYYISNFDLYLPPVDEEEKNLEPLSGYTSFGIPKLDSTGYEIVSFDSDSFLIEPYYVYDSTSDYEPIGYEEINLNEYAYIALALKDYTTKDAFTTTVQVKGQYCITPLYEFGLKSYDSINDTKVSNVCSPYYEDYTPVVTTITSDNLKNKAIYYVKAYDTSKENYIKVDTNMFDVTKITEEEKDNPYVYVQGKYYPTIAYDNLPSSATQNTEEGYIPGQVDFSFSDIFTTPLEFLEDVWESIVLVFDLIGELISLLPIQMQNFLYFSFMLTVAIGLIKILL